MKLIKRKPVVANPTTSPIETLSHAEPTETSPYHSKSG